MEILNEVGFQQVLEGGALAIVAFLIYRGIGFLRFITNQGQALLDKIMEREDRVIALTERTTSAFEKNNQLLDRIIDSEEERAKENERFLERFLQIVLLRFDQQEELLLILENDDLEEREEKLKEFSTQRTRVLSSLLLKQDKG